MNFIALKMLVGDRAKYLGIVMGLTFASLLLTQQSGIFVGLMSRTFGFLTDTSLPGIWVMDPKVDFIDDVKPLRDTDLYRVRGVEGVEWAMPLYKGLLQARLDNGDFQSCSVIGLDDTTLIGGPPIVVKGTLADLRRTDAVIVDEVGAATKLAKVLPSGRRVPLQIGDTLELNDHRAVVVGTPTSRPLLQGLSRPRVARDCCSGRVSLPWCSPFRALPRFRSLSPSSSPTVRCSCSQPNAPEKT